MSESILITGAGSGIGAGLARQLAGDKRVIVVSDVNLEAAEEVTAEISQAGYEAHAMSLDVTDENDLDALAKCADEYQLDVLINNAGVQHVAPLEDFDAERFRLLVDVLLNGAAMCCKAVLPVMRRKGSGRIINIGSVHSLVASPYKSAYVAAKHGLLGLSKVLALELADVDVTVNTVCPGYVDTPLVRAQVADQARHHGMDPSDVIERIMLSSTPKRNWISIEELTAAVSFLASPLARNITGQTLVIDGGWTAQ
ncbi:MAG: 3-hydroxybutyrate dehydrogenase [Lysobacteraceae bacterium]|nr:MAG: 3-hydroxybutyrate dehydrogenase [Xanthomonadaceae bacterium]